MTDAPEEGSAADDALVERLRSVAGSVDAVPEHVVEAARAAFSLRDLDARLAELVSDSLDLDDRVGAGPVLRGEGSPRSLTFETGDVSVDVEVSGYDGRRRVVGLAVGVSPGPLTVEYDDGSVVHADVDDLGRFAADVPAGRARLRLAAQDRPVITAWTTI